jgi:hypothetical protein
MAKFVEESFVNWGWSSTVDHRRALATFRKEKKTRM